jgi:hypothetical protein
MVPIPADEKWCVFILRVPAALNSTNISTLETALNGVTGIAGGGSKHLVHDSTPTDQVNGTVEVVSHVRIEPTEA